MKKFLKVALAAVLLFGICTGAWAEAPAFNRRQYKKNLAYNKNALPAGWQYEAGYTVWRMSRKLPANQNTYRRYKNDKVWRNRMHRYHRPEELALNALDWTVEELALLMREYKEYLKFHPAGIE